MCDITIQDLKSLIEAIQKEAQKEGDPLDLHKYTIALSLVILRNFMGEEWVMANIVEKQPGQDYFRAEADSKERYKFTSRVITFAEMMFNMRDVEGFARRVEEMRTITDVESVVAELQGAATIKAAGFDLRFRDVGYDADILVSHDFMAVEIKRKIESTEPSISSVANSLEKARSQLPSDRASFIFLNIPDTWLGHPDAAGFTETAIKQLFQRSGRISTVVLWWEEFVADETEGWWRIFRIGEHRNPNARFSPGPFKDIAALTHLSKGHWTSLPALVADVIPDIVDNSIRGASLAMAVNFT